MYFYEITFYEITFKLIKYNKYNKYNIDVDFLANEMQNCHER